MTTLQIDDKANLIAVGNFSLLSDVEAVKQDIKTLLKLFKSEYPFDVRMGIDWYNLASQNNRQNIEIAITQRILEDSRVRAIQSINVDFRGGVMNVSLEVRLKDGSCINV